MDNLTKVPGLYRSGSTGALINKDNAALKAYRQKKKAMKVVPDLQKRVDMLESIIEDLEKRLLRLENKE